MRFAIIGRTATLLETAETLLNAGHTLGAVVTAKEAPEYSANSEDFRLFASKHSVPFIHSPRLSDNDHIQTLAEAGCEIAVSLNFSGVIQSQVTDLYPFGILNAHGGDLPRYRGNACQAWAILCGEKRIGLCIHRMIPGELDSGDILARDYFPVEDDTRIGHVMTWMDQAIPKLFLSAITSIGSIPNFILEKQSKDPRDALRCFPRSPKDGVIEWSLSALEIVRLINASSEPFQGAFTTHNNEKLTIWRACLRKDDGEFLAVPGQITLVDRDSGEVCVATGKGQIILQEVESGGDRGQPALFIRSIRDRLGSGE